MKAVLQQKKSALVWHTLLFWKIIYFFKISLAGKPRCARVRFFKSREMSLVASGELFLTVTLEMPNCFFPWVIPVASTAEAVYKKGKCQNNEMAGNGANFPYINKDKSLLYLE